MHKFLLYNWERYNDMMIFVIENLCPCVCVVVDMPPLAYMWSEIKQQYLSRFFVEPTFDTMHVSYYQSNFISMTHYFEIHFSIILDLLKLWTYFKGVGTFSSMLFSYLLLVFVQRKLVHISVKTRGHTHKI